MTTLTQDQAPTVANITDAVNANIEKRLLTDTNFKVLSVRPYTDLNGVYNTVARISVDLYANISSAIAIPTSDRFSEKEVLFRRIDLAEAADYNNIKKFMVVYYLAEINTVSDLADVLNSPITDDDVEILKVYDATIVTAKPNSLGWVGSITFASAGVNAVSSYTATPSSVSAKVGDVTTVAIATTPVTAQPDFSVSGFDEALISVKVHSDFSGIDVTSLAVGTTTITINSHENPKVNLVLNVTVTANATTVQPASNVTATSTDSSATTPNK